MPEDCKEKFQNCIYVERNAEISAENQQLKQEILKLKEEIRILNSDKRDLEDLIIKLNMRMYLGC